MPSTKASTAAWFMSVPIHLFENFDPLSEASHLRLRLRRQPHDARPNESARSTRRDLRDGATGEPSHFRDGQHLTLFREVAPLLLRLTCRHKPYAAHNPQRFNDNW